MRFTRFVQCCVSIGLLFTPAPIYVQALTLEEPAQARNPRPEAPTGQLPQLSPEAPTGQLPKLSPEAPTGQLPQLSPEAPTGQLPKLSPEAPIGQLPKLSPEAPIGQLPKLSPEAPTGQLPKLSPEAPTGQLPKLSPGAQEVASEIGVTPLIERLYRLPERGVGGTMTLEALSLRQEITEVVLGSSLEVDGIIAEIDSELAQINAIRSDLEARRDRAINLNTIANIVTSGFTGVVGTALQFKNNTANLGNGIGVAGAGISTLLSLIGLRQQRGGHKALGVAPNLLARLFDKKPEFHSDYPEEVWIYLNAVPPAESGKETRRALLIKRWTELGRIESIETPKGQRKIELLTSSISQQRSLTIDLLDDRGAMLADVRAQVSLIKRDLSKLMLALRSRETEEKK